MIATRGFPTSLIVAGLGLATALTGCGGGGNAVPDGGDGHIDVDAVGDTTTEGGGTTRAIVVDTPSGTTATGTQDGHCDLLEAVLSVALGNTVGDCTNPDHFSRIVLQPGNVYPVPRTLRLAGGTRIDLADGAVGRATIAAAATFVSDPSDASSACLIAVADGRPEVTLSDLLLTQDPGLAVSGACIAKGSLTVRRAQVTGFRAGGLVATCVPSSGCDHDGGGNGNSTGLTVLGSLIDGNRNPRKGGGIALEGVGASLFVGHTAVVNNVSDADGGGIYLGGGWGTDYIQDSTISGNTASGSGGGLLVRFAEMTNTYVNILTSTIAYNTAGNGGGIQFDTPELGTHDVSVFGSIVAGNYSPSTFDWNINAGWSPRGLFNCVSGSFIYVLPGSPGPPTWADARSTCATRCWDRSRASAARATCRCTRCWPAAPPSTARSTTIRATTSATTGSTASIRRRPPTGRSSIPSWTVTATARPSGTSAPTSETIAGRPSCWRCARKVPPRTRSSPFRVDTTAVPGPCTPRPAPRTSSSPTSCPSGRPAATT